MHVAIGLILVVSMPVVLMSQTGPVFEAGLGYCVGSVQHDVSPLQPRLAFPDASSVAAASWMAQMAGGFQWAPSTRWWLQGSVAGMHTVQYAQRDVPLVLDGVSATGRLEQEYRVDAVRLQLLAGVEHDLYSRLWVRGSLGAGWYPSSDAAVTERILSPGGLVFEQTGTSERPADGAYATTSQAVHLVAGGAVGFTLPVSRRVAVVPFLSGTAAITEAVTTNGWKPWTIAAGVSVRFSPVEEAAAAVLPEVVVEPVTEAPSPPVPAAEPVPAVLSCVIDLQPAGSGADTSLEHVARIRVIADHPTHTMIQIRVDGTVMREEATDAVRYDAQVPVLSIVQQSPLASEGVIEVWIRTIDSVGNVCEPEPSRLFWSRDGAGHVHVRERDAMR